MSNKTQPEADAATESARKLKFSWLLVTTLVLFCGFWLFVSRQNNDSTLKTPSGQSINLETVNTDESRQKGLSGREKLDGAMLFVLEQSSKENCMWMKDMKFAIDVVWLDQNKEVIDVRSNVRPETYPRTFCPRKPAKYFLELNARSARELGFEVGEQIEF